MWTRQTGQMQPELCDRRQFSVGAALALLGGLFVVIGCGGGSNKQAGPSPSPAPVPPQGTGDILGVVGANHPMPHVAVITAAQLSAGAAVVLDISNGLHTHSVTLTSAQMAQIAAGARVSVTSSTDPHSDGSG